MYARFKPKRGALAVMLLMLMVLLGLATWQVQRLGWKQDLLSKINDQIAAPAVPVPGAFDDIAAWEYRRVKAVGSFLHNHAFLIKPRTHEGENGYHMAVPFKMVDGRTVIVNRGWVSDTQLANARREMGQVEIEGVLRLPRPSSSFTPDNAPYKNDWYWIDPVTMAKGAKIDDVLPVVLFEVNDADGYPLSLPAVPDIRNNHRQYAAFWFTMAGLLVAIFVLSHYRRKD